MSTSRSVRQPVSCSECRKMKRRCDRNNPCSNCAQRKLDCAYQRGDSETTNTSAHDDRSDSAHVDDPVSSILAEQVNM